MARKHRYRYYRSVVSLPALFVGIAWIGIWLLWPRANASDWPERSLARTEVVYIGAVERPPPSRDTDLIFLMSPELPTNKGPEGFPGVKEFSVERPKFLERDEVFYRGGDGMARRPLPTRAADAMTTYQPVWAHAKVPLILKPQAPSLRVSVSRQLRDNGLMLPPALFDQEPSAGRKWQATLHIEIAADGRPRHVFLESPSAYPDINAWLVNMLYRAGISIPGDPCEGWLALEYGGR